ncbi:hypothetical protein LLEC1_01434 [Akanthomyces lecanii]|uniref:U-box domain-containing protein n=1 Tax=Cordyceps confragosa TaxID=2714763 RepID=A0A179I8K8_CORDF|nr:hypothetical protein LLEC1_01434 [Akanthomyces lecanii]
MSRAIQLKEEGNRHFQKGDYLGAESFYSQAIIQDPKNPALYTNRAMARLKLSLWDSVITDCQSVLALPSTASATSLPAVTAAVLQAKKARWEQREKRRVREDQDLERTMLRLLEAERAADVAAAADDESERQIVDEDARAREEQLRTVFERSRLLGGDGRREVPDWAIDDISFGFMVDPVVTKTGKSYERASIMEHLRRHPCDPLTREPLAAADLRPNMALRQACEEFLTDNGWAADW